MPRKLCLHGWHLGWMQILPLHSKINFPTPFLPAWLPLLLTFSLIACPLDAAEHGMPVLAAHSVAIPAFVLQLKPDMLYTTLEIMSFSFSERSGFGKYPLFSDPSPCKSSCPPQYHQWGVRARSFHACIVLQGDPNAGRVNYTNSHRNYIGLPLA